jgi:para-nitrobenzyl esterase
LGFIRLAWLFSEALTMKSLRPLSMATVAFSLALAAGVPVFGEIQTAKVTGGEIKGTVDNDLSVFKGIPFAAPPVGELRWKAPQPVMAWTGVKETTAFGKSPMGNGSNASEDCLYLNVWSPAKSAAEKLPVMVWIYGGGFTSGTTSDRTYDGAKLARKGVVLVSVNYRLGVLGYLAHPELTKESGKGSGCYGIMDQIAGLKWVHDNIAQFGGDPNKVTIFGESAGGISVSMLTVAPAAKGLFQGAISESGGSMAPNMITGTEAGQNVPTLARAEKVGQDYFTQLGAKDLKAARELSAEVVQRGGTGGGGAARGGGGGLGRFWPVADGETIPGDQYELFQAGKFNDVNILVGTNSDEGASFGGRGNYAVASFEETIKASYGGGADAIIKAYLHDNDARAAQSGKDLFREGGFAWHTWAWANLQTQKGKGKAYVYYFDYHTASQPNGTPHGADVPFVFGNRNFTNPSEAALNNLMMTYWTNFAKTFNPNGEGLPKWPVYDPNNPQAMILNTTSEAKSLPNLEKLKAFDVYYAWRRQEANAKAAQK